jgi:hypothetical protein
MGRRLPELFRQAVPGRYRHGVGGRPAGSQADPAYALARSSDEYERLNRQAAFLNGTTERLFRAAGLEPACASSTWAPVSGKTVLLRSWTGNGGSHQQCDASSPCFCRDWSREASERASDSTGYVPGMP